MGVDVIHRELVTYCMGVQNEECNHLLADIFIWGKALSGQIIT